MLKTNLNLIDLTMQELMSFKKLPGPGCPVGWGCRI